MRKVIILLSSVWLVPSLIGCVSQKSMKTYVDDQVSSVDSRVDDVESQVEANQTQLAEHDKAIERQQVEVRPAPPQRPLSYVADLVDDFGV